MALSMKEIRNNAARRQACGGVVVSVPRPVNEETQVQILAAANFFHRFFLNFLNLFKFANERLLKCCRLEWIYIEMCMLLGWCTAFQIEKRLW